MNTMSRLGNLLTRIGSRMGKAEDRDSAVDREEKVKQIISAFYTGQGLTGVDSEYTWQELVASYASWVYTAVDKIQKTVAGAPKKLFYYETTDTKEILKPVQLKALQMQMRNMDPRFHKRYVKSMQLQRVEITDNPLVSLIVQPNPVDTQFIFWCDIMCRLELAGSCGIYKARNRMGVPAELWVLPTSENGEFKVIPASDGTIKGYYYSDGNLQQTFKPEEIIWLRYPNPKNRFEGMSALKSQIYPYNIDNFMMKQQYKFFKNNAVVGSQLTTDQRLSKAQVDELKDLMASYEGASNAYKTRVLHSGLKSDDPRTQTAKDMMLDVIGSFTKNKILSGYGVNEGIVGLTENQNKANLDASREIYIDECVRPRTQLIIESLERWLIKEFDPRIEMEIELPQVQQREIDITERTANLTNFVTTINEEREFMGLDPVDWGDRPFVPFSMMQYGKPKKTTPEGAPALNVVPEGQAPEGAPTPEGDQTPEPDGSTPPAEKNLQRETKDEKTQAMWKAYDASVRAHEPLFIELFNSILAEQEKEVLAKLEKAGAVVKGHIAGFNLSKVKAWMKANKAKMDAINIDKKEWEKKTEEIMGPAYEQTLITAGNQMIAKASRMKADPRMRFDFNDDGVYSWYTTRLRDFSKEVTGTTFEAIEDVLREGIGEGKPLATVAQDLREMFDKQEVYRAELIARTEAAAAYNEGEIEAVRQMGLEGKMLKFWINEPDARDTHQEAGRRYDEAHAIPIDEDFEVGDDSMDAPLGGDLPEENINCRCTLGYTTAE